MSAVTLSLAGVLRLSLLMRKEEPDMCRSECDLVLHPGLGPEDHVVQQTSVLHHCAFELLC